MSVVGVSVRGARECSEGALDLGCVAHIDRTDLNAERRRYGLDRAELADPGGYGKRAPFEREAPDITNC
jgi:hypothetical protein